MDFTFAKKRFHRNVEDVLSIDISVSAYRCLLLILIMNKMIKRLFTTHHLCIMKLTILITNLIRAPQISRGTFAQMSLSELTSRYKRSIGGRHACASSSIRAKSAFYGKKCVEAGSFFFFFRS